MRLLKKLQNRKVDKSNKKIVKSKRLRILGIDSGTKNSAFSVTDHIIKKGETEEVNLVGSGMISQLVENMKAGVESKALMFKEEIDIILDHYKPDVVIIELFFARGFRSNLATPINFMIGALWAICVYRGVKFIPVHAAVWKNQFQKENGQLKDFYSQRVKKETHLVDGLLISLFANPQAYSSLSKKKLKKMIKQLSPKSMFVL